MLKLSNYYKPTPARWRKIGDAMLGASTFITGCSLIANYHTLAITALIVGALGKFITNLFHEEQ